MVQCVSPFQSSEVKFCSETEHQSMCWRHYDVINLGDVFFEDKLGEVEGGNLTAWLQLVRLASVDAHEFAVRRVTVR